jgi:CheY-like chemotaxis protein
VKFTERGSVVVRAEVDPTTANGVRFGVADTGIGIPAHLQDRVFDAFFQADPSARRRHGGSGLGLAIAKRIVERMGGRIAVKSTENEGSEFSFTLQLPPASAVAGAKADHDVLRGARILVVDDNAMNREVVGEMVRPVGCEVEEAADAWEALERLRSAAAAATPFDVAVLDYQMPEMDGEQLGRTARADPALRDTALVLLTSVPQHDAGGPAALDFEGYLTKPVRQASLRDTLAAVLGRKRKSKGRPQLRLVATHGPREVRVLAVGDAVLGARLKQISERAGYACEGIEDPSKADAAIESLGGGIVFVDCETEAGRGLARRVVGRGVGSPIVVGLVAGDLVAARERWLSEGLAHVLLKPVRAEDVESVLRRYS